MLCDCVFNIINKQVGCDLTKMCVIWYFGVSLFHTESVTSYFYRGPWVCSRYAAVYWTQIMRVYYDKQMKRHKQQTWCVFVLCTVALQHFWITFNLSTVRFNTTKENNQLRLFVPETHVGQIRYYQLFILTNTCYLLPVNY